MAREFNVSVLVAMRSTVSRDLARMAGAFSGTERRVVALRRSLNDLGMAQGLLARKAQVAQRIDRDALTLLNARHAKLLALGDLQQTQAERQQINAQIRAREQRASIRRMEEQIRLQRISNDMTEKRALLGRAAVAARGERMAAGMSAVGGVAAIAAGVSVGTFELAKRGLPITQEQAQLRIAGGLNPKQVQALSQRALALSQRMGVVDWSTELQMALQLYQTVNPRLAKAMLGPVSYAADLAKLMNRGPLISSAGQIAQAANILGARNPRQAFAVSTDIANVLRSGGAGVTMGELSHWMTYTGGIMPGRTVAQRAAQMQQWALLAGRFGGLQGAFSGENVQHLVRSLTHPTAKDIAPIQFLRRYGLAARPDERTFANIIGAIRRGESANSASAVNMLDLIVGRSPAVSMFHQLSRISPTALRSIESAPSHNLTIHQMWATQMQSASARFEQMQAHLRTLSQVVGYQMDPALSKFSRYVSQLTDRLTKFAAQHPQGLRLLAEDVGLMMQILLRTGGLLAKIAGPGLMVALRTANRVMRTDLAAVKFAEHPIVGTEHLLRAAGARALANTKEALTGAAHVIERTGAVTVTGPVNVHVHAAKDPKATAAEVRRQLINGLKSSVKTHANANPVSVAPHLYSGPRGAYEGIG